MIEFVLFSLRFWVVRVKLTIAFNLYPYTWGKVFVRDLPGTHKFNIGARLDLKAFWVERCDEATLCIR